MIHWGLSSSPLSVSIRNWRVLGESTADVPPEEVGVVQQSSEVELIVVGNQRSLISETTAQSSVDKVENPKIGNDTSSVEGFDWELSNSHKAEKASHLGSRGIVGPVKVRFLDGSDNHLIGR